MVKSQTRSMRFVQRPLKLRKVGKTQLRTQFAALCYRVVNDEVQICLITSRGTQRWILPKGWPMHNQTPAQAAATEAWEEAGLTGKAYDICLGVYTYKKRAEDGGYPIAALVYPVRVKNVHSDWPEAGSRKRRWMTPKKAAKKLREPALKQIVAGFSPALVKR